MEMHERLAEEFSLRPEYVKNIIALIDEGNTIPFIARYRKEQTGSCDDQVLRKLEERLGYLRELEARRAFVRQAVIEQGKAEPAWLERLEGAQTMAAGRGSLPALSPETPYSRCDSPGEGTGAAGPSPFGPACARPEA